MSHLKKNIATGVREPNKMIIAAIDSLKGRKARPDEVRICNYVEKKFGLKRADAIKAINEAVDDGSILKVKYKDYVSYRNPAKFTKLMQTHVMRIDGHGAPVEVMKRVLRELRSLTRSNTNGATVKEVTEALHNNCQFVNYDEPFIKKVLQRAIDTGSARVLPSGNYILAGGKRIVPRKSDPDQSASTSKLLQAEDFIDDDEINGDGNGNGNNTDDDALSKTEDGDVNDEATNLSDTASSVSMTRKRNAPIMKRARPFSKRKKFKKSLGPDFLEPSELGLQYLRDTYEPKCDFCQLTSSANLHGQREDLLVCKDCSAKAHPSCMDYCKELADRSRRSPWQCMDCKTCAVCEDSGDGVCMLVCDMCDKGYHMNCHIPPVKQKPNGKWACKECIDNKIEDNTEQNTDNVIDKRVSPLPEEAPVSQTKDETKTIPENVTVIMKIPKVPITKSLVIKKQILSENTESNSNENIVFNDYPNVIPNPQNWTPEDVEQFIRFIGFPEQSFLFKEQEIDGSTLLLMRRSDVLTGFEMKLGPALKIYSHIIRLQKNE